MNTGYRILWMGERPPKGLSADLKIDLETDQEAAWDKVSRQIYDAYVIPANLRQGSGLDFIRRATSAFGVQPFIYLVDQMDLDELEAMRQGVFDFITRESNDEESVLSTVMHVIERQKHIRRLQMERDKLKRALEFVPDLIFTMDYRGNIVSFKSQPDTYFDFFQREMKEGKGIDLDFIRRFIPPSVMRKVFYAVRKAIRSDQNSEFEFQVESLAGTREFKIQIFRKRKGMAVCLLRDITALRHRSREKRSHLLDMLDAHRRFFRCQVSEHLQGRLLQLKSEIDGALQDVRQLKQAERTARSILLDMEAYDLKWAIPETGIDSLAISLEELCQCNNALNPGKIYFFKEGLDEVNWSPVFRSDLYKVIVSCLDILQKYSRPSIREVSVISKGKTVKVEVAHDGTPLDWNRLLREYQPLVEEFDARIRVLNGRTSRREETDREVLVAEFPIWLR